MHSGCKKCIITISEVVSRIIHNYFPWHLYRLYIIFVFYTFIEILLRVNHVPRSFRMIEWKSRFRDNMEFFPSLLEPWRDRDIVVRVIHAWRDYRENSECNVDNTRTQCTIYIRSHKWWCIRIMPWNPIVTWNRCKHMQSQTAPRWLSCEKLCVSWRFS